MTHPSRPQWRLFCLALLMALAVASLRSQTPALTTVSDTVFRANGSPASGVLLISWPEFSTAGGTTVAAGNTSVTLGTGGSMTVQLAPKVGATPAGTFYTVVYQLTDGTVKVEFWSVGTSSPETISEEPRSVPPSVRTADR